MFYSYSVFSLSYIYNLDVIIVLIDDLTHKYNKSVSV